MKKKDVEKFLKDFKEIRKKAGNQPVYIDVSGPVKEVAKFINRMRENYIPGYSYFKDDFLCCFDFLCDGKRVMFLDRKKSPQGIFPFHDSNVYLELTETAETLRSEADESCLPDKEFCERLYAFKDNINMCLKELGFPPLEGSYFATSNYISGANWIVGFDGDSKLMPADYYNNDEKAKIRYIGEY